MSSRNKEELYKEVKQKEKNLTFKQKLAKGTSNEAGTVWGNCSRQQGLVR